MKFMFKYLEQIFKKNIKIYKIINILIFDFKQFLINNKTIVNIFV